MEDRSLAETPTWSVVTVIAFLVAIGFVIQHSIVRLTKWLVRTRRKALVAALEAIMEELMVFGVLSLLLGHWTAWFSRICVRETSWSTDFYPCLTEARSKDSGNSLSNENVNAANQSSGRELRGFCSEGHRPFVSYESLEQLHRLLLVLVIVHVAYCFVTVAASMHKIYSWRTWETQAESKALNYLQGSTLGDTKIIIIKRQSTFTFQYTSLPCIQNKVLIWMVCFICQFWRSINKADYMVLRLGFVLNHKLHLSYNFHNYMLRSMEDEFRGIVGISLPLWGYAIICVLLNMHGTNAYFWLSFIPAALTLIVGTKLHHIVIQLALEVSDENHCKGNQLKPHDELFWFGKPELLLWLIHLITFQNAFEMATLIWSLWEIRGSSCFMKNHVLVLIRLTSGILFQFWCSYCTFPLYVIITQMGSQVKKALLSESVRKSLHRWRRRAKKKSLRDNSYGRLMSASLDASLDPLRVKINEVCDDSSKDPLVNMSSLCDTASEHNEILELHSDDEPLHGYSCSNPLYDNDGGDEDHNNDVDEAYLPYMQQHT